MLQADKALAWRYVENGSDALLTDKAGAVTLKPGSGTAGFIAQARVASGQQSPARPPR
ncbi:hypothetical protein GTP58_15860 [Duganella sp. CY15W]|uniref:hypothetical protein n=1 Tax=Duganella sp. CY15W TaxID=2692172 RepID=UPI001370FE0D|nr:hypothetical protein [Duganella sp. CY15W]MYM29807.1 hypothetical protein [Duganella sp. CY15W]